MQDRPSDGQLCPYAVAFVHTCVCTPCSCQVLQNYSKIGTRRNGITVKNVDNDNYCGVPVSDQSRLRGESAVKQDILRRLGNCPTYTPVHSQTFGGLQAVKSLGVTLLALLHSGWFERRAQLRWDSHKQVMVCDYEYDCLLSSNANLTRKLKFSQVGTREPLQTLVVLSTRFCLGFDASNSFTLSRLLARVHKNGSIE